MDAGVALAIREVNGRSSRDQQLRHPWLPGDHCQMEGSLGRIKGAKSRRVRIVRTFTEDGA